MAYLFFIFISFIWGTSFILMSKAGEAFGPVAISAIRMGSGLGCLLLFWFFTAREQRFPKKHWRDAILLGILANAYPYTIQPYLINRFNDDHSFFGMFVMFVPIITILVSILMLKILPTRIQLLGVLGGLAGMVMLSSEGLSRAYPWWVMALGFSVPLSYALGNTYIKWRMKKVDTIPLTSSFLFCGLLALIPLLFSPAFLQANHLAGPVVIENFSQALFCALILGIVGTGISIYMFMHLVKSEGPLFAGMVTYVIPVLVLIWGAIDGKPISTTQIAAVVIVLVMVALVQFDTVRRSKAERKIEE